MVQYAFTEPMHWIWSASSPGMIHVVISLILTPDKVVEVNESRCAITGVDANGVMLNVASNYGTLVSRKSMHSITAWEILYSKHLTDDLLIDLRILGKYWVGTGVALVPPVHSRFIQFCHAAAITLQ